MKFTKNKILFFAALFVLVSTVSAQEIASSSCIQLTSKPDVEIIRQISPPRISEYSSYKFSPGTIYSTLMAPNIMDNSSNYDFEKFDLYHFLWANRCNTCRPSNKGNGPELQFGTKEVRFYFTTINKANTCTLLQLKKLLNFDRAVLANSAKAAGLRLAYTKEQVRPLIKEGTKVTDTCFMSRPDGKELSSNENLKGIVLDYEVQDGRSAATTVRFVANAKALLNDKKLYFYSNDLLGSNAKFNGITKTSGPSILQHADGVGILLHSALLSNRSVASAVSSQLAVYGANTAAEYKKVYVTFEMNLSLERATQLRNIIKTNGLLGVMEWRNSAKPGPVEGKCSFGDYDAFHQKMICLAYGVCK